MIPATATKASKMSSNVTTAIPANIRASFDTLLHHWQEAVNEKHYVEQGFTHPADQTHGSFGAKYARLDIGSSGAFMVELATGVIFGIKGYGKVDLKKIIANAYHPSVKFVAEAMVRDRFRYGRFENNPDGSLRQPVVRR